MGRKEDILGRVRAIAEPLAEGEGLELVEAELGGIGGRTILRLFIDRAAPGAQPATPATPPEAGSQSESAAAQGTPEAPAAPRGPGVSLDDCSNFSRIVSAALDVEDPLDGAYDLEVSSPGLDRPLRKPEHFRKYAGQKVKVKTYAPLETAAGRKSFTGKLLGLFGGQVRIDVDGAVFDVPLAQISKANLEPAFDF